MEELGWQTSSIETAATIVARFNQRVAVYQDLRVRRALSMAVDNQVVLELGLHSRGRPGENHHVCPLHPDYAALPAQKADPAQARDLMAQTGAAGHTFELISPDDDWQAASADAIAAQCADAGIPVTRKRLPKAEYRAGWLSHPWAVTDWNMRPLGVQSLALAYRSGAAWNESGFANPEFDALLRQALAEPDAVARQVHMAGMEKILQDKAVMIQPYWRDVYRHTAPGVFGTDLHPMFEHHHTNWWRDPPLDPEPVAGED